MTTDTVARRMFALIAIASVFGGMPRPVGAGDERVVPVTGHRELVVNGRPVSEVVAAMVNVQGRVPVSGYLQQGSGRISGVALDTDGQPLEIIVELVRVSEPSSGSGSVETTATNEKGSFYFSNIPQGRYVVRDASEGQIGATSGVVSLAPNGMTFIQLGGPAQLPRTDDQRGKGVRFWTAVGAGAGFALGLVATANDKRCDAPESLCPLVLGGTTMFGALAGLLIGL